jgi:hypothetical protein
VGYRRRGACFCRTTRQKGAHDDNTPPPLPLQRFGQIDESDTVVILGVAIAVGRLFVDEP